MKELVEIQSRLNAPKGQYNKFAKFKYRSCEDILAAVKPLLKEMRCTLTVSDDVVMVGNRIYIKATAILKNDSKEKEVTTAFAREAENVKGMDSAQVTGAASSYARKYALNGLFAIDDTKDADTLNNNAQYTQNQTFQDAGENLLELLNAYAIPAIEQAKTAEELKRIWSDYSILQPMQEFTSALTAKRKALGIKNMNEK